MIDPLIRIAVCDDNRYFLAHISHLLSEYYRSSHLPVDIQAFTCGEDLINTNKKVCFNIAFIDIEMSGLSGLEVAQLLSHDSPETMIVFVSGLIKYAPGSHRIENVHRYLLKSELDTTLDECLKSLDQRLRFDHNCSEFDFVDGKMTVHHNTIICVESQKHQVFFTFVKPTVQQRLYASLDEVQSLLGHEFFLRIHQSFLVNMKLIAAFKKSEVLLPYGITCPISQRKYSAARKKYYTFMGGC